MLIKCQVVGFKQSVDEKLNSYRVFYVLRFICFLLKWPGVMLTVGPGNPQSPRPLEAAMNTPLIS